MALLELTNGRRKFVSAAVGVEIWRVKNGFLQPSTPEQQLFVKRVYKVRLGWRNAPEEYVRENLKEVAATAMLDWVHDSTGRPLYPSDPAGIEFALKYGLWDGKKAVPLGKRNQAKLL